MKQPEIQGDEKTLQLLRMVSLLAAFLYITFGFFMQHVLGVDDLIPLGHRVVFAICLGGLAGLSYISSLVRKHMSLLTYALGCAAILNVLVMGTQGEFDAGSVVALLLVTPIMNFLFYRWKFLLCANALLFAVIVGVFTVSGPTLIEILLFLLSSAAISGVSFWFTRRVLSTEEKSAAHEQMFHDLFQHSMEGIAIHEMVFDQEGRPVDYVFVQVNPTFEEYTGLKNDEILGKRVTEVLPGIEESAFIETYGDVVRTRKPVRFEQFSEPLQRHYRVSAYPMGGNRFATAFEDITSMKQTRADLQERSEFVEGLIKAIPDAVVYVFDTAARQNVYASRGLEDLLGYTAEEFQAMGNTVLEELIHPADLGPFMEHLQLVQTSTDDEVRVFEYRMRHRAGHWVWIENRDAVFSRDDSGVAKQIIGTAVGITERKKMEIELRESEERFRTLFEHCPDGVFILSTDGIIIDCNKRAASMNGYTKRELVGCPIATLNPEETTGVVQYELKDKSLEIETYIKTLREQDSLLIQTNHRRKDNTTVPIEASVSLVTIGGREYTIGFDRDVSERHKVEDELRRQSGLTQSLLDSIPDMIFYKDVEGVYLGCNPAFAEFVGLSTDQIVGKTDYDLFDRDIADFFRQHDRRMLELGRPRHNEEWVTYPDGPSTLIDTLKTPYVGPDGQLIGILGISRDITERKQMEDALRESEERYRRLAESSPVGLFRFRWSAEGDFTFLYFSETAEEITGVSIEAVRRDYRALHDYIHPGYRKAFEEAMLVSAESMSEFWQEVLFTREEETIWLEVRSTPKRNDAGDIIWDGVFIDIDRRKRVERQLAEERQRLENIITGTNVGTWECNLQTGETRLNSKWAEILGYTLQELEPVSINTWLGNLHPEDFDPAQAILARHMQGELEYYDQEARMRHRDGHWVWVQGRGKIISWSADGKPEWMFGTHVDITDRKQAELVIASEAENRRILLDNIQTQVWFLTNECTYGAVNEAHATFLGMSKEDIAFKSLYAIFPEDVALVCRQSNVEVFTGKQVFTEEQVTDGSGEERLLSITKSPVFAPDGSVEYVVCSAEDITEERQIEEALKESRQQYQSIVENTPGVVYRCLFDQDWTMLYLSDEIGHASGYAADELLYSNVRSYASIIHPEDSDYVSDQIAQAVEAAIPWEIEYRLVRKDGEERWVRESGQAAFDQAGEPESLHGLIYDITTQKLQEAEIARQRERLELFFSQSLSGAFFMMIDEPIAWSEGTNKAEVLDYVFHHQRMTQVNQAMLDQYGADEAGFLGQTPYSLFQHDLQHGYQIWRDLFDKGELHVETHERRMDGTPMVIEGDYICLYDAEGRIIGHFGVQQDVTDRKEAEAKLVNYAAELELRGLEMERLYAALDAEIQNAREAHQRLVQTRLPRPEGLSLAAVHNPASYIGGDFAYAIQRDELLILYVTDITGHGLEGTIFGLFVKGCIEFYLDLVPKTESTPNKILAYLDEQVHKGGYPSEYAVSIFLVVLNVKTREAAFSSAGFQNPPVLVHRDGLTEMLVSQGLPISPDIAPEVMEFDLQTVRIPDNAFLFLATDGIYEQRSGTEMYEQRLLELLTQCGGFPHSTVKDAVDTDFQDFLGEEDQDDDVTFVVLSTQDIKEYTLPSSWGSLGTAREHVLAFYRDHPECNVIVMAAHELVANAIEHGNKCDTNKRVKVLLSDKAVVVEDEGDGFAWRTRINSELLLECDQERGRGIAMVQMLGGQLVYNDKGNRVSFVLNGMQ